MCFDVTSFSAFFTTIFLLKMLQALWGQSVGDFVTTEVWLSQKNTHIFIWHYIINYILYIIDCQMRFKVYLGLSTILNQQIQDVHNISNTFSFILQMFLYFVSVQHLVHHVLFLILLLSSSLFIWALLFVTGLSVVYNAQDVLLIWRNNKTSNHRSEVDLH